MAQKNLQHELMIAMRLAREAGVAILGYYGSGVTVGLKQGEEPVTIADQVADDLVRIGLREAFPDDGLLTEESEDDPGRLDRERVWIVDPLDGTTEFINETGEFAVQIALAIQGKPVMGVVYQPSTDRLQYAVRGQGAFEVVRGTRTSLRVSTVSEPAQMRLVASRSHYSDFIRSAQQRLGIASVARLGSVGLKVARVAKGECDLYLATAVVKEWDLCAPHMLLMEAGGVLTDLCGEQLTYNKAGLTECRGVAGSNGQAHNRIVQMLTQMRQEADGGLS